MILFIKYKEFCIKSIIISCFLFTLGDISMIFVIFCKETFTDSLRNDVKLSHRSKANASLSAQGLKYPLRRAAGKAENACSSRNSIIHRASSNRNQTSASNRTRVEVHSNVHRPDTLPTARRANVPASTRDSALRHSNSKAMNSNERLLVQPNGRSNIQVI